MSLVQRLAGPAAWSLGATIAQALGQWAMLAGCARLAGTESFGRLAWAAAAVLPLHLLAGLQQRTAIATSTVGTQAQHLRLRQATAIAVLLLAAVWSLLAGAAADTQGAVLGLALARGAEGLGEVGLGRLQRDQRFAAIAGAMTARAVLTGGGAIAGAWLMGGATGTAAGAALGSLVVCIAVELPLARRAPDGLAAEQGATRLALSMWPLGVALGLTALAAGLPRLALGQLAGERVLALFAAAATVAALVAQAASAAMPGAAVLISRLAAVGDAAAIRAALLRLSLFGAAAGLVAAALAWPFGGWALALVFGGDFRAGGPLLAACCLATAVELAALPYATALTALGRWRQQLPMLVAALATAAGIAWILIPRWGVWAGALSLVVANLVRLAWASVLARRALAQIPSSAATSRSAAAVQV